MAEFSKSKAKFFCEVCDREFQYSSKYRIHLASINHRAMEDIIKAGSQSPDVAYTDSHTELGDFSGTEVEGACTELGGMHSVNELCTLFLLMCVNCEYRSHNHPSTIIVLMWSTDMET